MSERALTCREVVAILSDYLEDALSPSDRGRVEEHLAGCEGCTAYLVQMRETIRLTGVLAEDQIPDEQKRELLSAFQTWSRDRPDPKRPGA